MVWVDVSRTAPVLAGAEIVIEAPVETVWAVISDIAAWPSWNSEVSQVDFHGSLSAGAAFAWVGGGSRIVSRLEEVVPCQRLAWSGRTMGLRAIHVWEFSRIDSHTHVFTEESFEGFAARILPGLLRRMLDKALRGGLAALKREAESRHHGRTAS